ncbi:GDSL esterase/lipase At1g29670 [Linum perenne]
MPTPSHLTAAIFIILAEAAPCFPPPSKAKNEPKVNGMFVFGSSLVDNGNNQFLPGGGSGANYRPYGIDFPLGTTGRYTNGKNVVDLFCEKLGLPLLPASHNPATVADVGKGIFHGVNFASGGSGILNDTGAISGQVINLSQQIEDFENTTLPKLEKFLHTTRKELLPKYIILVGVGGNDYSLNYFINQTKPRPTLEDFTSNLISSMAAKIEHFHRLGARKFVLMSVYPLGCSPIVLVKNPVTGHLSCSKPNNEAALLFNQKQKEMVDRFNQKLPGSKLVVVNAYGIVMHILTKPKVFGFQNSMASCCETTSVPCKIDGKACSNRRGYVYFDALHPTEAVNIKIVDQAYSSTSTDDVYPINVKQLAEL